MIDRTTSKAFDLARLKLDLPQPAPSPFAASASKGLMLLTQATSRSVASTQSYMLLRFTKASRPVSVIANDSTMSPFGRAIVWKLIRPA